jgi:hypothetical protein
MPNSALDPLLASRNQYMTRYITGFSNSVHLSYFAKPTIKPPAGLG